MMRSAVMRLRCLRSTLKRKPWKVKVWPDVRNRARLVDDEAGDGGGLRIRQIPVHRAVEIADRHRAVDIDRAVRLRPHARHRNVVLVGDVADDFLEDVLEGDHALDLAILVDHEREVRLAAAERLELLRQRTDVGHEPRRQRDRHDVDLGKLAVGVLDRAQQILGMQDADDVLRRVAPERDARVLGLQRRGDDLLRWAVGIDRHHFGAVDHHVGHRQIAQVEQPAQHVAVVLLHAAFEVQQVHRAADFLMRRHHRLILADMDTERAEDPFH